MQKLSIPKEHHRLILGKSGTRLNEIAKMTSTKIHVPLIVDPSEEVTVIGTKEGVDKAIHEIQVISDEQVLVFLYLINLQDVYKIIS